MQKFLKTLVLSFFLGVTFTAAQCYSASVRTSKSGKNVEMETKTVEMINQIRAKHGLKPLAVWDQLCVIARGHSLDMAEKKVPFGHQGFEKRSKSCKSDRFMYGFGENVAFNYNYKDPVKVAVDGWMESPGHRKNILGDYYETGVGIACNPKGEWYFTQLFAKRDES